MSVSKASWVKSYTHSGIGRTDTADRVTFPTNKIPNSEEIPHAYVVLKALTKTWTSLYSTVIQTT